MEWPWAEYERAACFATLGSWAATFESHTNKKRSRLSGPVREDGWMILASHGKMTF
jgi:hypothetical protein